MEISNWCNSGSCRGHIESSGYDRIMPPFNAMLVTSGSKPASKPRWRLLWRKIMKEKRKLFDCSSTGAAATKEQYFSYDPYTYSLNFDQGTMWSDPDNVSRTFSARFAVPARIFDKGTAPVLDW